MKNKTKNNISLLVFIFFLNSNFLKAEVTPSLQVRLESIQGAKPLAERVIAKPKLQASHGQFTLRGEVFAEADTANKIPYRDGKDARLQLQELYVEWTGGPLLVRVGQQALRWSDSWSLPSLDYWTARKFDRLFLDPLEDQLKHSTGTLLRYTSDSVDLDAFGVFRLAQNDLPRGSLQTNEDWDAHGGLKAKLRLSGFDISPTYAYISEKHHYGAGMSYALEDLVPKLEWGSDESQNTFYTAGFDLFLGDFTFFPQFTLLRVSKNFYEKILYLPVRFTKDKSTLMLENYLTHKARAGYFSVSYSYDISEHYQLGAFFQNYDSGSPLNLIAQYRQITEGWVTGLRLQSDL